MRRLSQKEFEMRMAEKCPDIEPLEPYVHMKEKVLCRCKTCGLEWRVMPATLFSGSSCPTCGREKTAKAQRKPHSQFVSEVAEVNPAIEVLGEYVNGNAPVSVRCKVCGYEWSPRAQSLLKGYGCWECGKKKIGDAQRKTHDEFIAQIAAINPNVEILGEYEGDNVKIDVRCKVCGNEWQITPGGLIAGRGCAECGKSCTSFPEQFILQGLRFVLGEEAVLHRDGTAIGSELDIYIPAHRVAVEPGGWFWHKGKLEIDAEKRRACSEEGIRLLTVYDGFNGDEPPFDEDCLTYPFKLGFEKGFSSLKGIVSHILDMCGSECSFTDGDWDTVIKRARRLSAKMTTEEFVEKLSAVNGRVIIKGAYVNNKTKIDCECPTCGYRWKAAPSHLLSGEACPACAGTMKRTHESFAAMMAESNPAIEILGKYTRASERVEVRCRKCGHVWSPTANSLQQGRSCPKCAAIARGASRRLKNMDPNQMNLFECRGYEGE